jgi:hypothetical protein
LRADAGSPLGIMPDFRPLELPLRRLPMLFDRLESPGAKISLTGLFCPGQMLMNDP